MALANRLESCDELLDAQAHIWNYIFKFTSSMSLKCATDLGIPDIIHKHGKPMPLAQLIDALPINKAKSQCVHRLMRILVHCEFFVIVNTSNDEEKEGYWLTPASRLLLKDEPLSVRPLLQLILDPILMEPWHYVSKWLSDNHHITPFEMANGRTIWEYMEGAPRVKHLFNEAMASDGRLTNLVLLKNFKQVFQGFESFVDVAGGTGATAMAVAEAFPDMTCMVLDLPHVVAGLEGTKNLAYVAGDMFEAIPHAQVVLLKWILHDWGDEESVRILKKCKEAIGGSKDKGGKVIIIDVVLNNGEGGGEKVMEDQLFCDVATMAYYNGKERSEREWAKLFSDAGFSGYKVTHGLGVRSLIEVYP